MDQPHSKKKCIVIVEIIKKKIKQVKSRHLRQRKCAIYFAIESSNTIYRYMYRDLMREIKFGLIFGQYYIIGQLYDCVSLIKMLMPIYF